MTRRGRNPSKGQGRVSPLGLSPTSEEKGGVAEVVPIGVGGAAGSMAMRRSECSAHCLHSVGHPPRFARWWAFRRVTVFRTDRRSKDEEVGPPIDADRIRAGTDRSDTGRVVLIGLPRVVGSCRDGRVGACVRDLGGHATGKCPTGVSDLRGHFRVSIPVARQANVQPAATGFRLMYAHMARSDSSSRIATLLNLHGWIFGCDRRKLSKLTASVRIALHVFALQIVNM